MGALRPGRDAPPGPPYRIDPSHRGHRAERRAWMRRRTPLALFVRMAIMFGVFVALLSGVGALGVSLWRLATGTSMGSGAYIAPLFFLLLFLVPWAAVGLGRRAFRSIATPIAHVMAAADAVAQGDLSARVEVGGRGEFNDLARSFNHMVGQLQEEDQRRRNLTADVAHELRTPLQIIQGNLEGVIDGVYAPTPEHLAATLDETRHLARLVEDLRVLSQAEAGQLPMQREPVDVAELVADVVTSFSVRADEAGILLEAELPPQGSALTVLGDYGRLDQVLSNLVANALRHTPAGGQITLAASMDGQGACAISVRDTGEGIAPDALPYIFDRFYRADPSRTRATGGSGLGLAIARQLVLAHGGRIDVASAPGQGSTFTLHFPARPATA